MAARGIFLPIVSEFKSQGVDRAIKEFKTLEKTSDKVNFAISKAALPAAAALAAVGAGAFKAAQAASDLSEEQSKVGVVFGESAKDVLAFSKTAARSLGQSQRQALEAAGTFGTLGKAAGLTGQDLSQFATKFTGLASDLASFNNTSPEEAIQAIGAALRGEAEPIRRYGVLLNDATLRQKALELGLVRTTKQALDPQTKSLAAQAVILEQTADAQGDFARTSGGAANQQRILQAQVADATAQIGRAFLPVLEKVLPLLSSMAGFVSQNSGLFAALAVGVGALSAAILVANGVLKAWRIVSAVTIIVNTALATSFTAVQIATGIGIIAAVAGAAALAAYSSQIKNTIGDVKALEGATGGMTEAQEAAYYGLTETELRLGKFVGPLDDARNKVREYAAGVIKAKDSGQGFNVSLGAGGSAADKLADKIRNLRKTIRDDFGTALGEAQKQLEKAKDEFNDLAKNVSESITSAFSFKDAKDAATETGQSFLDALTAQVAKTRDFAVQVNRLLAAGLSEDALQQVLAAGTDAGTAIATELLDGGAAAIAQANSLTAEVQTLGTNVGNNAATQFRSAGVIAGQNLVDGINEIVSKFRLKLSSKKLTTKQLKRLQKRFGVEVDFLLSGSVPALANGGIVRATPGGTLALIGEGGRDEAVIPLNKAGGLGGGTTIVIQGAIDPVSTARQIERILSGQTSRFGY
jgi:hypothetical protein